MNIYYADIKFERELKTTRCYFVGKDFDDAYIKSRHLSDRRYDILELCACASPELPCYDIWRALKNYGLGNDVIEPVLQFVKEYNNSRFDSAV